MAKPLRGECTVDLGGETFTLRLSLGDLEELEDKTKLGIIALAASFTNGQARLTDAHTIIRQGFTGAKIKMPDGRLTALLEKTGIGVIATAAALLLSVFVDDDQGNAEAAEADKQ